MMKAREAYLSSFGLTDLGHGHLACKALSCKFHAACASAQDRQGLPYSMALLKPGAEASCLPA